MYKNLINYTNFKIICNLKLYLQGLEFKSIWNYEKIMYIQIMYIKDKSYKFINSL